MTTKHPLENICKEVGKKLINMYHHKNSERLIFPKKRRDNKVRVSEQEARFIFASIISADGMYRYAVEVPTQLRYSDFSTDPRVYVKNNSKKGRSGAIDLSLFNEEDLFNKDDKMNPTINVEFKEGNCDIKNIKKDILKLVAEPSDGLLFHLLESMNKGTLINTSGKNQGVLDKYKVILNSKVNYCDDDGDTKKNLFSEVWANCNKDNEDFEKNILFSICIIKKKLLLMKPFSRSSFSDIDFFNLDLEKDLNGWTKIVL